MGYDQTQYALEQNSGKPGIYNMEYLSFTYLLYKLYDENEEIPFYHPALDLLQNHDRENGAELFKTLYYYLVCDRNVLKTATVMHLHRNTVHNRLVKFSELLPHVNLENLETRVHLLLSYIMRQGKQP